MIQDTLGAIFDFILETNLTEEFFYEHKGPYPVFSGQTEEQGIVAQIDSYDQTKSCVTVTTYGKLAGKMYYRNGKYTIGRNCMGLRPKEEYKSQINLAWFSYRYQGLFYQTRIGPRGEGQKSLNKALLEKIKLVIPDGNAQKLQLATYERAQKLLNRKNMALQKYQSLMNTKIGKFHSAYSDIIGSIFDVKGGNSGLTEEFIYNNLSSEKSESVRVLSGATIEANMMGAVSKNGRPNGEELRIFKSPAVLVVRKGNAGQMTFVGYGAFTTNDDAYVMTLKPEWRHKVNARWFCYQYQELFRNLVTSKSDNATFNKDYAEKTKVELPSIEEQNRLAKKLLRMDKLILQVEKSRTQIKRLLVNAVA